MNTYFLPGTGIFGGIKAGFQFAEALARLGRRIVVATPQGVAPSWFKCTVPVIDWHQAMAGLGPGDAAIFSLPHDYVPLKATPARLVFHCQGTDPLIDPVLADGDICVLTCWAQAADYVNKAGRRSIDVGISVSDCFFYDGAAKVASRTAYMPRRGRAIADACIAAAAHLDFTPIDGLDEDAAADVLKQSTYYIATAENEWFGLPALEAMAAGCVVLSVPTLGGREYLIDGRSGQIAAAGDLPLLLRRLSQPDGRDLRARLRTGAAAVAARYRPSLQRAKLRAALEADLGVVLS